MKETAVFTILLAISLILVTGCTQTQTTQPASVPQTTLAVPVPAATLPDTVKVSGSSFGNVLVDAQGRTLYFYANDVQGSGTSTCTELCITTWPAFSAGAIQVSTPLNPADFATIIRPDGSAQTTYKGWPLYYSTYDLKPGDINGSGIDQVWNVANIPGTVVTTPPTTIPTPTQTASLAGDGGGGGY
jgi:predicted lipoprotein with Yx(FWY)xxD motif